MKCHTCKEPCEAPKKCSKCQKTIYCSPDCQAKDWKQHRRSVCLESPLKHKLAKQMKKPAYLAQLQEAAWAERVRNPEPSRFCDGCFRLWDEIAFDPDQDETDERCGPLSEGLRCKNCDWTACKDCLCPENQAWTLLDHPTGTCRCLKSNFNVPYCIMTTSYFHGNQEKQYLGDRHPDIAASGYPESAFEDKARKCKNCGDWKRCLKKEYRTDKVPLETFEQVFV